ncbi:MAG: alpha/beta hydrolase [Actinomycetota bacterium]|nr:alpha/beta hydrolase [Actinomycetota bacterium]
MTDAPSIRSRDGLALEAAVDAAPAVRAGLVLCHPHPQMGGTMNAPLLCAVRDEMVRRSWGVLRFNFRGIGGSEGAPSLGIEEVADAGGATDHARTLWQGVPLAIAGWSFGAAVAVRLVASGEDLIACAAIAPAVNEKPGVTAGLPAPSELDDGPPLLFVCAANDRQVLPEDCSSWANDAGAKLVTMRGANHFFWGKYDDLAETVGTWLDARLEERT